MGKAETPLVNHGDDMLSTHRIKIIAGTERLLSEEEGEKQEGSA